MRLTSPEFENGQSIPARFTCDGGDARPDVAFSEPPEGTASLALIVDDPDAPSGLWTHWVVWDIPPQTEAFDGGLPEGAVQGRTSSGMNGWHGPCPPNGTHHYYWRLYALDTVIGLPADRDAAALRDAMKGHILAECSLMGTYSRG